MPSSFEVQVPGKWVLAGEHAVIRGAQAVALPHPDFGLRLTFQPQVWEGLSVIPASAQGVIEDLLGLLRSRAESEGRTFPEITGSLQITSSIPIGAGLGSSAALCVAMTRWMSETLGIPREKEVEIATWMENRFHGKSSGMDVAVICAGDAIAFVRGEPAHPLGLKRLPRFTFHDTGLRASTRSCVVQVELLRDSNLALAQKFDEQMGLASRLAIEGLQAYSGGDQNALRVIADSMNLAQRCFEAWNLVPPAVESLRQDLLRQGALAVKTTGAGGGGMLVALWA